MVYPGAVGTAASGPAAAADSARRRVCSTIARRARSAFSSVMRIALSIGSLCSDRLGVPVELIGDLWIGARRTTCRVVRPHSKHLQQDTAITASSCPERLRRTTVTGLPPVSHSPTAAVRDGGAEELGEWIKCGAWFSW